MSFEEFADPKNHRFGTFESRMALAYRETIEELKSAYRDYWKAMRVDQVDDPAIPFLLPEYEDSILVIEAAEMRLSVIQTDIEDFVSIVGGYSRREIAQELRRCELEIAKAKRQARRTLNKAIEDHPDLSIEEVEQLGLVREAFSNRDCIIAELKPIMAELDDKLNKSLEILRKY